MFYLNYETTVKVLTLTTLKIIKYTFISYLNMNFSLTFIPL